MREEFYDVVKAQPMFGYEERVTNAVLDKLQIILYQPEDVVVKQGTYNKDIFFIVRGKCEVYKTLYTKIPLYVKDIKPGNMMGEVAAVLGCSSPNTIISKSYSTISFLSILDYNTVAMQFPKMTRKMHKTIRADYKDPMTVFFMERYMRIDYLARLDKKVLEEISFHLKIEIYENKYEVLTPGQICKQVYIVMRGVVQVFV